MVGEDITVAGRLGALSPPSLDAQVEDQEAEREEEEDVGEAEGNEDEEAGSVVEADFHVRDEGGIGGGEVRVKVRGVKGGRGVQGHDC